MGEALVQMSTMKDIYNLPEGERAELIDGELYTLSAPSRRHQRITGALYYAIYKHIEERHGVCEVNIAPFGVFLFADESTYVEPDICVVCDPEKLNEWGCAGAPDWMIEVTSPSTKNRDFLIKLLKYRTAGVKEYWIVDGEREIVAVYSFERDTAEHYGFTDQIRSGICHGLEIDFSKLNI